MTLSLLEHSFVCLFVLNIQRRSAEHGDRLFDSSEGLGVGAVKKGTLGADLKEQQGIFHEDVIKLRLGTAEKCVSGSGKGRCKASGAREQLFVEWGAVQETDPQAPSGQAGSPGMVE